MASFHRSGFYGTVQSQGGEKHAVILAHTGTDGLALVQTPGFNVMVLDIMLPGLDGFEVVRRLRKAANGTPIMILTARDGESDTGPPPNQTADSADAGIQTLRPRGSDH